ncbi:CCA tRNA nucleotidyltransferase [Halalkalibacterium ligniniphilum]|uniref:CCA tRNA nucleotidyltransferase n=1 Tax=Halalkalibacterium ligniniphilum TaxID=1134413 RepID=UPI000348C1C2|nr:CCA tRNA nucleotidyltransferase [Halalkalibacterium ligniniphilum]
MNDLLNKGLLLVEKLQQEGFRAAIVGGAVRDYLLGKQPVDLDLVTSATPEQLLERYSKSFQLNNRHATVTISFMDQFFEVTTERGKDLTEDLAMRDFTMNSIAMDKNKRLIDPLQGEKDLKAGVIRSHEPRKRMAEDPLRMLRALRFVSQFGFSLDPSLKEVMTKEKQQIKTVAVERIEKELERLLIGEFRKHAWQLARETSLLSFVPGLTVTAKGLYTLEQLPTEEGLNLPVHWASFCLANGEELEAIQGLRLAKQTEKKVRHLCRYFAFRQEHSWDDTSLYTASLEVALGVEQLRKWFGHEPMPAKELYIKWNSLPIHSREDLQVDGRVLMEHFKEPGGPWIGAALNEIEQAVLAREIKNEKETLLQWVHERRNNR